VWKRERGRGGRSVEGGNAGGAAWIHLV